MRAFASKLGILAITAGFTALASIAAAVPGVGYAEYYVLGDEADLIASLKTIPSSLVPAGHTAADLNSRLSIVSSANGVQIYLDEWEDGYDFDPANPATTADAKWDVSTASTGGNEQGAALTRGQVLTLSNTTTFAAGSQGVDGGDRFYVTGAPICVVRTCWPTTPGTYMSGNLPLYPVQTWDSAYTAPIGQDVLSGAPFGMTDLFVQAQHPNTRIRIFSPTNVQLATAILNQGQNYRHPAIVAGTRVVATNESTGDPAPIQAGVVTSSGGYNSRYFTLTPDTFLKGDFYIPVPSMTHPSGDENGRDVNTAAYIFATSANTPVEIETAGGVLSLNLNAGQVYRYAMPRAQASVRQGYFGAIIRSTDPTKKISIYCAADDQMENVDFGFSALPSAFALKEYFVPYGPNNPVHMTPLADNTTFFVDYDANGTIESTFVLDRFETNQIYDPQPPGNRDLAGARITATAPFVMVWGQDDTESTPGEPSPDYDQGYTVLPLFWYDPALSIAVSPNPAAVPVTGGTTTITTVTSTADYDAFNVQLTSNMPTGWAYVPGTTSITFSDGSPAYTTNPTIAGQLLTWPINHDLAANQTITLTYQATTTAGFAQGFNQFVGSARADSLDNGAAAGNSVLEPSDFANVFVAAAPTTTLAATLVSNAATLTNPGQPITYTLNITNNGPATAQNVGVGNPLPAGTTYVTDSTIVTAPNFFQKTFYDTFASQAYTLNAGNTNFLTDWTESTDGGSATGGSFQVVSLSTNTRLRIAGASSATSFISRGANLTGATAATVQFNYRRVAMDDTSDTVVVEAASSAAGPWTNLATYNGTGTDDPTAFVAQSPLTIPPGLISATTQVRFRVTNTLENNEFLYIDNFLITANLRPNVVSAGGSPALLAQGYTLNAGESMTVVYQAAVNQPLPAGQLSIIDNASVFSTQSNPINLSVTDLLGRIGDFSFNDLNGNAAYQPGLGETPRGGVRFLLRSGGADLTVGNSDDVTWPLNTSTGAGAFGFTGLMPGNYRVSVDLTSIPADYVVTTGNNPANTNLFFGENEPGIDYGFRDTDADDDGIPDVSDNCINTPNPGQEDCDGDGIGDVCDPADSTPPVITVCAGNQSAVANASCEATVPNFTAGVTANDPCDPTLTITQSPVAGSTVGLGVTSVTITVTNDAGLTATCSADFTVTDTTNPVISVCASNQSATANASCQAAVPNFTTGVTASDNCDSSLTITQLPTAGTLVGLGVTSVTITVTDDAGNFVTCSADFTVTDGTNPVIGTCAADQSDVVDASCEATVPDFTAGVSASDNCDTSLTITQSPTAGSTVGVGVHTVTITVTDDAGNTDTCTASFTVTDDTDPVISACAADLSDSADASCEATVPDFTGDVTASDNCDTSLTITQSPTAGSTVGVGVHTVTITVTDDAGNTDTCTASFTVTDDSDPVISACAADLSDSADASCEATVPDFTGDVTASDNCGTSLTITQSPTAGSTVGIGVHTVTITVTDDAGNTDTCTASFTVTDDTDPVIGVCAAGQSASADASCEATVPDFTSGVSASDNCDTSLTITQDPAAGTVVGPGVTSVTITVTDDAGNTATCSADFTVNEDTDPVISACAADLSASADASCEATVPDFTGDVTASDNCDTSLTITQSPTAGSTVGVGVHTITITVTDDAGNTDTCTASFTVTDDTDPVISVCAADLSASADASCEATVPDFSGDVTASDNCDTSLTITQDPAAGTTVGLGVTSVTITVTDDAGNTATCSADFTVTDDTDPVIGACAAGQSASADASCEATVPDFTTDVTASDNCDASLTITQDPAAGTTVGLGVTSVTITVTDDAGNSATCSADFTVTDDTDPVISACAADQNDVVDASCEATVPDFTTGVTASDNCDTSLTITQSPTAGSTVGVGVHTVTITVTDDAGNTDTCTASFTVTDDSDPVISACAADLSDSADASCEATVPDFTGDVTASDNCDTSLTITQSPTAGSTVGVGVHTVTITVTDDAGNTDTCTASFTVTDDSDPVISACAADLSDSADASCEATVPDFTSGVSATDNCDTSLTITQDPAAGTVVGPGVTSVTITVTDDAGNTATCSADFTVNEDTDPVISACAADLSASADASCEATVPDFTGDVTASDNCDTSLTITQSPTAGSTVGVGVYTITITVTDDAGNTDTCTASFTVTDDTDPVIGACAAGQSASADASCEATVPDFTSSVTASDNCDSSLTITQVPTAGTTVGLGVTSVTITVTDDAGNTATCSADFTVTDDTDPVIGACAAGQSASADASCEATVPDFTSGVSATDNCDTSLTITQDPVAGTVVGPGVTSVTITVTDDAGNSTTCSADFTVNEDTDPVISACAADLSASADASCEATVPDFTGDVTASDNCDTSLTITQSPTAGSTVGVGVHTVTITVTDDAGNTDTCTASFTVTDDTDPVIGACAAGQSASADASCEATVPDFTSSVTASDNCDSSLTITQVPTAGTTVGLGVTSVTITVTDDAGNSATCSADFTVTDDTDPVIGACAAGQSASADASCEATVPDFTSGVSATDNCDSSLTITQDPAAGTVVGPGVTSVTITVTDDAGNTATCSADFTVNEDTDPVISACAADLSASADASCEATVPDFTGDVTASDNCDTSLTITQSPTAGSTVGVGVHTVTITVTDDAGNFATCTADFTVTDDTDPVIGACAAGQSASADASCEATVPDFTGDVTASDNCDTSLTITQDPAAGTTVGLGVTSVTITVTDDAGNTATCSADFTVTDDTDPVIGACAAGQSASADASCEATVPDFTTDVTASDNCDTSLTITQDPAAGTTVGLGVTSVTITVTDDAGNSATCSADFTVTDDTDPVIGACAAGQSASADASCEATVPDFTSGVSATDNCDASLTITQDPAAGTVVGPGVTSVTITVTDDAGNTATCSADFTVNEDTDPVIATCATNQSASADATCQAAVPDFTGDVTASDNCDTSLTITQSPTAGTLVGLGVHTITITVTDDAGNTDTCTASFTVTDDTDPVIGACAPDQTVFVDVLCEATVPNFTSSVSTSDNCDASLTITQSPLAGMIAPLGNTTITITVTDDAGNSATCTATLTVEDNIDPIVVTPAPDQSASADVSCEATVPNFIPTLMATDNCGYSVAQAPTAGTVVGLGAHTITLTITDAAGNSVTDEALFTVNDTTAPAITCPSDSSLDASGGTAPVPNYAALATATDNCDPNPAITQDPAAGTPLGLGPHTITLTATDASGNSSDCTVTFTVTSSVAPSVTIAPISSPTNVTFHPGVVVTFSEDVTGLDVSEFVGTGCTITNLQGSGANYTIDVTLDAPDGTKTISLPANSAINAATNGNSPSNTVVVQLDTTPPTIGSLTSVSVTNVSPIAVNWVSVVDPIIGGFASGLAEVHLWYSYEGGAWTDSGLSDTTTSGSFSFTPPGGLEGDYEFSLLTIDALGNASSTPTGPGQTTTLYDPTAPFAGTVTVVPAYANTPFTVSYSGASDPVVDGSISDLAAVELWYSYEGGPWTASGLTSTNASDAFTFNPPGGLNGLYAFAMVATDNAGNSSATPSGAGDDSIIYDTVAPNPGIASVTPDYTNVHWTVEYTGATDPTGGVTVSGLDEVTLWYSYEGGPWTDSGLTSTGGSGSFNFVPPGDLDGLYAFALSATDNATNASSTPTGAGDDSVVYDTVAPNPGVASVIPDMTNMLFTVEYTGANDPTGGVTVSGLDTVALWYTYEGGPWTDSGLTSTGGSGSFNFVPPGNLNGEYIFALSAVDNATNESAAPSGGGDDSVIYDTVAPIPGVASVVPDATNMLFNVDFTGAFDPTGGVTTSDLDTVELWYSYEGGAWTPSGFTSTLGSGSFAFVPPGNLEGLYEFALVATDNATNSSTTPPTSADDSVIYDLTPPDPGTADIPAAFSFGAFTVNYGVADDPTVTGTPSGFAGLALWYSYNGGPWVPSGQSSSTPNGSFTFIPTDGDGTYSVQLVAIDNAGNVSATPSGTGDDTVTVVSDPSGLGEALSPPYDNTEPTIPVTYINVPVGLPNVDLWYSYEGGPWTDSGLSTTGTSGSFDFFPPGNLEGEYHFGIVSNDGMGTFTPVPTGNGDTTTIYDLTDPIPGTADVTLNVTNNAFNVTYTGGFDPITDGTPSGLAEVQLWFSVDGGPWQNSGLTSTGGSGSFFFDPPGGTNGVYSFALVGVDNAGNVSATPMLPGDDTITYDTIPPSITNCPTDFGTPCNTNAGYNLSYTPFAIDATATTYTVSPSNPLPYGTTIVTVVVTDEAGNSTTCEFSVDVQPDLQPPVRVLSIGTEDGYLRAPTVSGGRTDLYINYDTFFVGDSTNNGQFVGLLSFDTTGLPTNATVTSARIRLVRTSQQGSISDFGEMKVAMGMPVGPTDAPEGDDWMSTSATYHDVAEHIEIPTLNAVNTFVEIRENYLDLFNRNGRTQFQFAFERPTDNDGYFDYISFRAGDYVVELERPELIIEYVLEDCFEFPAVPPPTQGPFTTTIFSNQVEDGFVTEWHWSSEIGYLYNTNAPSFQVGDSGQRQQLMGMLSFDTSSIPANATIDSVEVRLYRVGASGNVATLGNLLVDMMNPYYSPTSYRFGSTDSLLSDDFQAHANFKGVAVVGIPAKSNQYTSNVFLSPTGLLALNKGGKTQMRLRFELPDDGDPSVDAISFAASDYGLTSPARPRIIVTYRTP